MGSSVGEFIGLLLLDLLKILAPVLIVILIVGLVYIGLLIVKAKFADKSEQKIPQLLLGAFSQASILLIEKLPTLLIILAMITGFSFLVNFGTSVYKIYENQTRIKELTVFCKNLGNQDKIAQIIVGEKGFDSDGEYGMYEVDIYDSITGEVISENEYKIKGRDLRLDSMVINFEYSEIGGGSQKNLAFPYRIFSNKISPEDAIVLENLFTTDSPDTILDGEVEGMLGLSREAFRNRAKEFIEIIKDPLQSQELGIRSSYGNTITIPANAEEGDEYAISVEATGGLSLKKIEW